MEELIDEFNGPFFFSSLFLVAKCQCVVTQKRRHSCHKASQQSEDLKQHGTRSLISGPSFPCKSLSIVITRRFCFVLQSFSYSSRIFNRSHCQTRFFFFSFSTPTGRNKQDTYALFS
ncbi:hypothetical protein OUZ56_006632 [Daphnia magna]|uniref:Uncharacterized protein n=1 Tax=Daphnia magna TaxID=35525 RepID=A0ABQ9YW72_9CRUS|nr:hypothetical protein OUZ56_006632 [Daphnia magna]